MSEENFNRLVSSELQGNSYLHSETVYSIRWAQNEIKSLREEVERLQAVIDEVNAQEPFDFYEVAEEIESRNLDQPTYLWSSGIGSYELYELLSKLKLYARPIPAQQATQVAFLKRELVEAADIISENTNLHPLAESMRMAAEQAPSPRITEQDAREIASVLSDIVKNYECGDDVDKKLMSLLDKLNSAGGKNGQ